MDTAAVLALEEVAFCMVCMSPFTRPITLACGHTYCEEHLDQMLGCAMRCDDGAIPPPGRRHANITLQSMLAQLDAQLGAKREIDPSEVEIGDEVHRGTGGSVFRGTFRAAPVAVKQLHLVGGAEFSAAQRREIELVRELAHPCILQVIGTCSAPHAYVITSWCAHGDLGAMIAAQPECCAVQADPILRCVASAVAFLHERNILHRDLKPSNVLMRCGVGELGTTEHVCALADFGIARTASAATMTGAVGTPAYSAPEVLKSERYGAPADVWGFGAIAHELFHGVAPYAGLTPMQVMMKAVQGIPPALDAALPESVRDLLAACACAAPAHRPTMVAIVSLLPSLEALPTPAALAAVVASAKQARRQQQQHQQAAQRARTKQRVAAERRQQEDPRQEFIEVMNRQRHHDAAVRARDEARVRAVQQELDALKIRFAQQQRAQAEVRRRLEREAEQARERAASVERRRQRESDERVKQRDVLHRARAEQAAAGRRQRESDERAELRRSQQRRRQRQATRSRTRTRDPRLPCWAN